MFARRVLTKNVVNMQKRSGHWLHKNIRVEENAGLREITYLTWEFTFRTVGRLLIGIIIPSYLVYQGIVMELKTRDTIMGEEKEYAFLPPLAMYKGGVQFDYTKQKTP